MKLTSRWVAAGAGQSPRLAAQNRLPAVYADRDYVQVGGLMSYDADWVAIQRRLEVYVDKFFKGAKPGDLPVEQPTIDHCVSNVLS